MSNENKKIQEGSEANFSPGSARPDEEKTNQLYPGKQSSAQQSSGPALLTPGQIIAERYKIEFLIGQGAMGAVYSVEQIFLKKRFALKTLNPIVASDIAIRRFQKEAQAASRLEHANLVRAVDFGLIDGLLPFLVMDYIQGPTLAQHLEKVGTLPIEEAAKIFTPICFALNYAHKEGVIHRDLKPGNIVLVQPENAEKTFVPSIIDFGIAKLDVGEETAQSLTQTGEVFGTPLYMSPEQCSGKKIDNRSDIYSLGCVLFEALTGAPPFRGESALETMMLHLKETAPTLAEGSFGREFPGAMEQIVSKMLAKEPRFRYGTCAEIAADLMALHAVQVAEETGKKVDTHANETTETPSHAKAWNFAFLALLLVVALGFGIKHFQENRSQPSPASVASIPVTTSAGTTSPVVTSSGDASDRTQSSRNSSVDEQSFAKTEGALPQIAKPSFSVVKGSERIFDFGPQVIGGMFWSNEPDYHPNMSFKTAGMHHIVSIPASDFICLQPSLTVLSQRPEYLRKFAADQQKNRDPITALILAHKSPPLGDIPSESRSMDDALFFANHFNLLRYLDLRKSTVTAAGLVNLNLENKKDLAVLKIAGSNINGGRISKTVLKRLRHLDASLIPDAKLILRPLLGSNRLKFLCLRDSNLTNADAKIISTMPALEILEIQANPKVSDAGISYLVHLKNLKTLKITRCGISPDVVSSLGRMKKLTNLEITCTGWSKRQVDELKNRLPHCRVNENHSMGEPHWYDDVQIRSF